jgi:hypothetical protein
VRAVSEALGNLAVVIVLVWISVGIAGLNRILISIRNELEHLRRMVP